ncbi:MAG: LysR family transcriptional regulator [Actinobacteria bacterium]|nr:LysR family transcriptional regulator [Actinomycetota bacterium]
MDPRDRPEVSTDDLRILLALARTGKLVAAAALVGVDHTTIRRRLRRLESAVGHTLIERGADGWSLTESGRTVAERAAPLEEIVQGVREAIDGDHGGVRGNVRISAPDGFGIRFTSEAIAAVVAGHPGITVELVTSTRPLGSRLTAFDIAISIGEPRPGWLRSELLTRYALGLYASHAYLARGGPIEAVEDLADHRLIFYVDSDLSVAELDLARGFQGTRVGVGCTSVFAQLEVTARGGGIGLLPGFLAEGRDDLVRVLPEQVRFELAYSLGVRRESPAPQAVEVVCAAIRRAVAERRDALLLAP